MSHHRWKSDRNEKHSFIHSRLVGYPKFGKSAFNSDCVTPIVPTLRIFEGFADASTRAALRWYVKALATPYDVDRFAFLWIALEILAATSSSNVERPYVAPCQHEITSCPICGKSTTRRVQGPSLIDFLGQMQVSNTDAKDLWRTRQMFHGSNPLTQEAITSLPRLLLILKSAVANTIKNVGNIPPQELPLVSANSSGVNSFALGGSRKAEMFDLQSV